jgi:hypothetical protein
MESERQLEDLVIDVIYAGMLKGKLHHCEKVLQVEWAAGRDVRQEDLTKIQLALSNWWVLLLLPCTSFASPQEREGYCGADQAQLAR